MNSSQKVCRQVVLFDSAHRQRVRLVEILRTTCALCGSMVV